MSYQQGHNLGNCSILAGVKDGGRRGCGLARTESLLPCFLVSEACWGLFLQDTLQFHHWSSVPRGARGTVTVSGIGARRWGGEDGGEDEERWRKRRTRTLPPKSSYLWGPSTSGGQRNKHKNAADSMWKLKQGNGMGVESILDGLVKKCLQGVSTLVEGWRKTGCQPCDKEIGSELVLRQWLSRFIWEHLETALIVTSAEQSGTGI